MSGPEYPKRHERSIVVQQAKAEFGSLWTELEKKFELTESEMFLLLSEEMALLAAMCIKSERKIDT